jgi:hypothetical protein
MSVEDPGYATAAAAVHWASPPVTKSYEVMIFIILMVVGAVGRWHCIQYCGLQNQIVPTLMLFA